MTSNAGKTPHSLGLNCEVCAKQMSTLMRTKHHEPTSTQQAGVDNAGSWLGEAKATDGEAKATEGEAKAACMTTHRATVSTLACSSCWHLWRSQAILMHTQEGVQAVRHVDDTAETNFPHTLTRNDAGAADAHLRNATQSCNPEAQLLYEHEHCLPSRASMLTYKAASDRAHLAQAAHPRTASQERLLLL
jgi:hypothetical protein